MFIPEPFASEFANLPTKEKVYILILTLFMGGVVLGCMFFIS